MQDNLPLSDPVSQPTTSKRWIWIAIIAGVLLLMLIAFVFYKSKQNFPTGQGDEASQGFFYFFMITGLIVIVGLVIYIVITDKVTVSFGDFVKPVYPKKAVELFKRNIAKEYQMDYYLDKEGNIQFPNPNDFLIYRRKFAEKSGQKFFFIEWEINSGKIKGIHTSVLPLSLGEEAIENAYYWLDPHTSLNAFQLQSRVFPLAGAQDRIERYLGSLFDIGEDIDPRKIQLLRQLSTPQSNYPIQQGFTRTDLEDLHQYGEIDLKDFPTIGIRPKPKVPRRISTSQNSISSG